MLFTPIDNNHTGIGTITDNRIAFSVVDGTLVCNGTLERGTELAVYNMGGVKVSSAVVGNGGDSICMNIAGLPHGSYIVVVKGTKENVVYKVVI